MILFHELQETTRDLIAANPFFAGVRVVADLGFSDSEIEEAKRDPGAVVVVAPLLSFTATSPTPTRIKGTSTVLVRVILNPTENPKFLNLNIYRCVEEIIAAVLAYPAGPGEEPFALAGEAASLTGIDKGVLAYDLRFTKSNVLPAAQP